MLAQGPEAGGVAGDPSRSPAGRTYQVRTYGCQMNVHDSERLAGLLEAAGYRRAPEGAEADVVVFNTCAVRENADNKLYGNLSHLVPRKQADPDMQIAVGGCLAQKDREHLLRKAPWVDVVFGTHNIGSLPALLDRARHNRVAQVEIAESLREFPSTLPAARESAYAAWVSISVGCNNTCTFCIVPSLRGKEVDRRPADILAEVRSLVDQGVLEVTLLGQNVNAYGVSFADPGVERDRGAFAALLRSCGDIDGLERVRFTSPHPAEFTDDVIEAMAQTPNVCPALHMPLQSGSDRMLRAMRRSYRAEKYLGIIERVRAAMPHAAITTDIIVGFPGETEDDFAATLDVVRAARFATAFTFQYSKRPGTPAAELDGQLPKAVVQERYSAATGGAGADLAGGERRPDRHGGRTAGGHRRGPQGRQHRPNERTCARRPAGALHSRRHRGATRRHRHHHHHRCGPAPPDRRRAPADSPAHPRRRRARRRTAAPHRRAGPARDRRTDHRRPRHDGMCAMSDFEAYRAEIEAAERKVAGEIQPGGRAMVVAILVFVLLVSLILPHTGGARGVDVLMGDNKAISVGIALPSRIFSWLALVFGVGFSMLALLTRRWVLAWIALAGCGLASATGMLAVWSRQTAAHGHPGPGVGLIIGWITVILLTFHWARVVWTRTAVQLAAEEQRRREAAERQSRSLLDDVDRREGNPPAEGTQ